MTRISNWNAMMSLGLCGLGLLGCSTAPAESAKESFSYPRMPTLWNQPMGANNKINIYFCWKDAPTAFFKNTAVAALADTWESVTYLKFTIAATCPAAEALPPPKELPKEDEMPLPLGKASSHETVAMVDVESTAFAPGGGSAPIPVDAGVPGDGGGSGSGGNGEQVHGEGDDIKDPEQEGATLGRDAAHPIPIYTRAEGPYVMGLGSTITRMNLDPAWNPPNSNNGGGGAINCAGDGAEGARMVKCIRRQTIHEFGHAIGLAHEHNRPDRVAMDPCPAGTQGTNGTVTMHPYDRLSIMSYCADYTNPVLTNSDVETIRQFYGTSLYSTTRKDFAVLNGDPFNSGTDNVGYYFNGANFTKYNVGTKEPFSTVSTSTYWPFPIRGASDDHAWHDWPATWSDGIDTVVTWGDPVTRLYFFRDGENLRYDVATDKVDWGPHAIADNWTNWPVGWTNVQAGVYIGSTADTNDYEGLYFFRGTEYLRYDIATNRVPAGYPKSIAADWKGMSDAGFGSDIDYVFMVKETNKRKLVFVKGHQQIKYDLDDGGGVGHAAEGVVADSKKPIYGAGNYPGLGFAR